MTRALQLAAAVALLAGVAPARARADVWSDATGGEAATVADQKYRVLLEAGDDAAVLATRRMIAFGEIRTDIENAIKNYTQAAVANPTAGEPYARIAMLIYSFYFEDCDTRSPPDSRSPFCEPFSPSRAKELIAAWDALEARAPLDPRIAYCPEPGHLPCAKFERAILNTKLGTTGRLEAAERDYKTMLERAAPNAVLDIVTNNLAETYMMLGDLDDAIDTYRLSVSYSNDISTALGLAVALDRDGEAVEAKKLVAEIGPRGFEQFAEQVQTGQTFFVPQGEVYYYLALAHETLGDPESAVDEWQAFIDSGAHPRYQPRAKEHLALLRARLKLAPKLLRPAPPLGLFDE